MIRLRSCQSNDLAGLYQLDQVCFTRRIAYSKAELSYFLTNPRCSCWIAEEGESKLAGFVIVERAGRNGRLTGHIVTLDVDPAERRRGVGTLLMQTAEEMMKLEGARVMSLEVAEDNSAARGFYQRLGFITTGRISKFYAGRIDAEVMEKVI
jgi:ribosomal-protein-alanine N-acetyltransferase